MRKQLSMIGLMFIATILPALIWAADRSEQTLQIQEGETAYRLSVPVSQLVMTIPKGSLVRTNHNAGGSTEGPRYFYFEDANRGLIISGWFEPDSAFGGTENFWASETAEWRKRGMPEPKDVQFKSIAGWSAISYNIKIPGMANSHLRAHYVKSGTWIDAHLSVTSKDSEQSNQEYLEKYLKSISVTERE